MARKAKTARKPKAKKEDKLKGHNAPKESKLAAKDLVRHHHQRMISLKKKLDDANADYRNARKSAKTDGINLKHYDAAVTLKNLSDGEQKQQHNNVVHYLRCLGVPLGKQLELFDAKEDDNSIDAIRTRAYDRGYQDGLDGEKQDATYDPGTPAGQSYHTGWRDGQNELAKSAFTRGPKNPPNGKLGTETSSAQQQ